MDLETALQQLAPLREPDAIGLWPLAPGWWLLLALTLAALLTAGLSAWRRWHRNRYRRLALTALDAIVITDSTALAQLNALLKATALRAWPVSDVAQLHGEAWIHFLHTTASADSNNVFEPLNSVYEQDVIPLSPETLAAARAWVKNHRGQHA